VNASRLPEQFADLEPLVSEWALAKQGDREKKRVASTAEEIRAFYDTMLPRMEAILAYLSQFPVEGIPEQAKALLFLTFSLTEISAFVEFYDCERAVPNSFAEHRFVAIHKDPLV
jgi:hypothetical protein